MKLNISMCIGTGIGLGFGIIFGLLVGMAWMDSKYKEKISKGKPIQIDNVYYVADEVRREVIIYTKEK